MRNKGMIRFNVLILTVVLGLSMLTGCVFEDRTMTTAMEASYYGIVETNMSMEEKLEDFEYMYELLKDNYPFFKVNKRLHNVDWLGNKKQYTRKIKSTQNDAEFLVSINDILNDLNNPHTHVFNGEVYKRYYKHFYPFQHDVLNYERAMARYGFDGNVETIQINPEYNFLISNEPVLKTDILIENKLAYLKIESMSAYHIEEDYSRIQDFLKEVEDYEKLIIDIRGNLGGFDKYWHNLVEFLIDEAKITKYYSFFRGGYRDKYRMYKVSSVKPVDNLDEEILAKFPPEVKTDFDEYTINYIMLYPFDELDFKGKVYLLVDRNVFSSSEKFASFAKDTGFATLVGETTGGDRVFPEIPFAYLPNSGLVIRFSAELGINSDGTINMETRTVPDIQVDPTPNEDFKQDKCIQAVIEDKN
ncbi:S41 family peptidase [uncultured Tissierella sp.]|uniref:S41 family peptidase n=1 Tax=uncultured Tissierella sp. TaxID=448160 RepID=UPI002805F0B2|nr:S41 family peptidase [uncultured Tissierella sp.]MDU5083404.1 S41 family peptidase [Bacillota bacterium]